MLLKINLKKSGESDKSIDALFYQLHPELTVRFPIWEYCVLAPELGSTRKGKGGHQQHCTVALGFTKKLVGI